MKRNEFIQYMVIALAGTEKGALMTPEERLEVVEAQAETLKDVCGFEPEPPSKSKPTPQPEFKEYYDPCPGGRGFFSLPVTTGEELESYDPGP